LIFLPEAVRFFMVVETLGNAWAAGWRITAPLRLHEDPARVPLHA
jgi:hypothetical protein